CHAFLDIPVPAYSLDESVGSSISLIVLSDTETEMTVDIPEIALEAEALLSLRLLPLKDSSEEDTPEPYEATIARWRAFVASRSSSLAFAPPASLQIVPTLPGLPRIPAILVLPRQEIPLGRPDRTHPNRVRKMLIARKRVHPFPARLPANYRRSRYVSSSSSPSPRKRRKVSPHSSSSASPSSSSSDGPSHKRGRLRGSSSAFHQENSIEDSTEIGYEASVEGSTEISHETDIEADVKASAEVGTKVGVEVSIGPTIKIDVDVIAKLDIPPVLPEQTVEERLKEHEEVIQEMYEHPLEMPLQRMGEVEEEIRTLTSRLETTKAERTALRNRVRSLEMSKMSFHDTLRFERERFIGVQRHLGMTPEAIEEVIAQRVPEALETYEANRNRTVGTDATYAMTWKELMKLITEVYCQRNEIQKMDSELWNLTVKGNDVTAYTQSITMECDLIAPSRTSRCRKKACSYGPEVRCKCLLRQADSKKKWRITLETTRAPTEPFKRNKPM
ncbi:hypothetical protein Tco_0530350, partial [Tanacetum coccineum]